MSYQGVEDEMETCDFTGEVCRPEDITKFVSADNDKGPGIWLSIEAQGDLYERFGIKTEDDVLPDKDFQTIQAICIARKAFPGLVDPKSSAQPPIKTLRDEFAMAAMPETIRQGVGFPWAVAAFKAYEMADAMLAERNKPAIEPTKEPPMDTGICPACQDNLAVDQEGNMIRHKIHTIGSGGECSGDCSGSGKPRLF